MTPIFLQSKSQQGTIKSSGKGSNRPHCNAHANYSYARVYYLYGYPLKGERGVSRHNYSCRFLPSQVTKSNNRTTNSWAVSWSSTNKLYKLLFSLTVFVTVVATTTNWLHAPVVWDPVKARVMCRQIAYLDWRWHLQKAACASAEPAELSSWPRYRSRLKHSDYSVC